MAKIDNLLSPSLHKRNDIGSDRQVISLICPKHGYVKGNYCPNCAEVQPNEAVAVHTHDWVKGVWEHIAPEPIKIESKEHLIRECEKRGVMPRAFMKPRSRGAGFEIAKGR
jgi:hypothetical protein